MSEKGYLKQIHPVLPVKDVTKAIDYYCDKLGFRLQFKDSRTNPAYAGVGRDGIELHLQWHDAKEWELGIDRPLLRILSENVDHLFTEYKPKNVFHPNTNLNNTAWGTREFGFYDLDSNGLIFYKNL